MKKCFLLSLFPAMLLSSQITLKAQVWTDVNGGATIGNVFAVYADKYDSKLYVGGNFDTLGPDYYPSRGFGSWDGTQWVDLTGGNDGFGNDFTRAIGRYNGQIYHSVDIGAIFYGEQTEDHRIAKFSCTSINCHGNTAYAFQEYQGELYVGGTFLSFEDTPNDLLYRIIKWNGISWSKVGGGFRSIHPDGETGVHALFIYQGKLYAGGSFDTAGTVACNSIAVWNGTAWSNVGTGLRGAQDGKPKVKALTTYKGSLIAGGVFDSAGSVAATNIAKWNGTSWISLNATFDKAVMALCVYKKVLYAGGGFSFNGIDSNHIAGWDGTSWSPLGGGITGGKFVRGLTVWNRMLIAGGTFTELEDTIAVNNIAAWKISNSGGNLVLKESDFVVAPNIITCPALIRLTGLQAITQIEVIDQCGIRCLVQEFSGDNFNTSIELQAANWSKGIYILRLHTAQGMVNKKIVVM